MKYLRVLLRKIDADKSLPFHEHFTMIEFNHCFGINTNQYRYELWLGIGKERELHDNP
jgi:hypothetical protein